MTAVRNLHGPLLPVHVRGGVFENSDILPGRTGVMIPGTGVSTGTGTVYTDFIYRIGDVIKTEIFVDLTGLNSSTAGDIIGVDGGTANCHFGRVTTANNGLIFRGCISCVETPATGEDDIDVYSADEATGAEDAAVSGLTETAIQDAGANYTKGVKKDFTGNVVANQYLYLVGSGGGTAGTYTAGQFLIEMWGFVV
jgi:hypothetical protein